MNYYIFRRLINRVLLYIIALIFAVIMIFPLYWMVCIVFSPTGIPIAVNPRFLPTSFTAGISKIRDIFVERGFLRAYFVSFTYSGVSCLIGALISSMAAYEFALYRFTGKNFIFGVAMAALLVPKTVFIIPLYLFCAKDLNWLNTFEGLIVPGLSDVFGLFMLTENMKKLPKDLFDAAEVDGASHFQTYWKVALPLSKNIIFTLVILIFMRTWANLTWPMIISSNQQYYTVSRIINWFNQPDTWVTTDNIMTANLMSAIPPILVYLFFQQYVMKGIAYTGIKE